MNTKNFNKLLKKVIVYSLFCLTCFLTTTNPVFAQSARAINNQVDELMTAIRNKQNLPDISGIYAANKKLGTVLEAASGYLTDSTYKIRLEAYKMTYMVALKSSESELKSRSLEQFTSALNDINNSISGYCARQLSVFDRDLFSTQAKSNILSAINRNIPRKAELIRIAGYLNLKEIEEQLRTEALSADKIDVRWAAYLALARMDDKNYAEKVASAVRNQGINDEVVYELVPDLIYTRQKVCIDLAIEILFDEKKNCRSSNPDNPVKMQCGYRVMEYLAPVIAGFPFNIRTSGDIDTDNYEKALITVREWFLKTGDDYIISDNSY